MCESYRGHKFYRRVKKLISSLIILLWNCVCRLDNVYIQSVTIMFRYSKDIRNIGMYEMTAFNRENCHSSQLYSDVIINYRFFFTIIRFNLIQHLYDLAIYMIIGTRKHDIDYGKCTGKDKSTLIQFSNHQKKKKNSQF